MAEPCCSAPLGEADALGVLRALCRHEGVPESTAQELIHFLRTKQVLSDLPPHRRMDTSPSSVVDRLWHELLLNTSERDAVEASFPGLTKVPHSTRTAKDPDAAKLQRMAVSLTAMHNLLGVLPQLQLWQAWGYNLRSVSVPVPCAASQGQAHGDAVQGVAPSLAVPDNTGLSGERAGGTGGTAHAGLGREGARGTCSTVGTAHVVLYSFDCVDEQLRLAHMSLMAERLLGLQLDVGTIAAAAETAGVGAAAGVGVAAGG